MKSRIASLSLITLVCLLVALPVMADDTLYSNGGVNGTVDAWTVNFGYIVSDTFTLQAQSSVETFDWYAWVFPGDVVSQADVSITSDEFGGTTYFSGTVNFTQSGCSSNQFGYNVCLESGSFDNVELGAGANALASRLLMFIRLF